MTSLKKLATFASLAIVSTSPIFAGVTVSSPANGAKVSSPFTLKASASSCSSQPVSAIGYSLDNSTDDKIVGGSSVSGSISSGTGWHTVHVKAWGNKGAVCVTDSSVNVTAANSSLVPSGAKTVSSLQNMESWKAVFDKGTNGWASGNTYMTGSPSRSGRARQMNLSYGNYGGIRFHTSFGDDANAKNFFWDAWIWVDGSAEHLGNLEMDMNQTMPNGQTVIYGVQCDGYSNTWDVTKNAGSPTKPNDNWVHTGAYCNPRAWSRNAWHHVQLQYSRDSYGKVTYKTFWLDGKASQIWLTVPSAFALGWGPTLLTNIQLDGLGSGGKVTALVDNLTISRW